MDVVEGVLEHLEQAQKLLRGHAIEDYQAQEIQIRINELGMTMRSAIKPRPLGCGTPTN
jgi:hypothetical protein